jgi:hypothetical protein
MQQLKVADQLNTGDSQTCNYLYDDLSRLSRANCGTPWGQNFTYDAFGNIQKTIISGSTGIAFTPTYGATNQFSIIPGVTAPYYDQNGDLVKTI